MRPRRAPAAVAAAFVLVLVSCGGDSDPTLAARVDDVFARLDRDDRPGCAVGVGRHGRLVLAAGYGLADLADERPITARTTFDLASVSKQLTGAAVLLLAGDGVVSMDDDVRAWVPELPDYGRPVALDDLLHHSSGLPEYVDLLAERFDDADRTTTAQALDALADVSTLSFRPGSRFEYVNTNYFLLGLVVARASGRSLGDELEARVFDPLGMAHTVVRDRAELQPDGRARGHAGLGGGRFERYESNWEQVGDGSVWTDVTDLQRWAANLVSWRLGGDTLRRAMTAPGPVPDEDGYDYGGGLYLGPDGELGHDGLWVGYTSALRVRPDDGLSVSVLCNRDDVDPWTLAGRVLDAAAR